MKEATADLTSAIVVAISVTALVAFFYFTVWPMIKTNFASQTACEQAKCGTRPNAEGMVDCVYKEKDGTEHNITCSYKG